MNKSVMQSQNTYVPIYNEIGEIVNRNPNTIHPSPGVRRIQNSRIRRLKINNFKKW